MKSILITVKALVVRRVNLIKSVQIAATALEEMFTQDTWYLTLPEKWLQEKTLSISREYSVSEDLRLTLIDLALDIART